MKAYKILIADDDADLVALLGARLGSMGYKCIGAADGLEVIEKIQQERPDLVILDWHMPSGTGDTVMEYFKQAGWPKNMPVIVFTAANEPWVEESAKTLGAIGVFYKPRDTDKMIGLIQRTLPVRES